MTELGKPPKCLPSNLFLSCCEAIAQLLLECPTLSTPDFQKFRLSLCHPSSFPPCLALILGGLITSSPASLALLPVSPGQLATVLPGENYWHFGLGVTQLISLAQGPQLKLKHRNCAIYFQGPQELCKLCCKSIRG